jgi:hypothetical protein
MSDFYSGWVTPPNGKAKYRLHLSVVVRSQNVVANTSTLAWALTLEKDRSFEGFYAYPGAAWAASINGHSVLSGSGTKPDVPWNGWSAWTFGSGTYTVTHAADGTMVNMPVVATWTKTATNWAPGSMSLSTTMTLPTIVRATVPTVTPSPAAIGSQVTIGLPAAVGTYTHDIAYVAATGATGTIATGVTGDQLWTVPDVIGDPTSAAKVAVGISVITKSGGTAIGTRQVTLLVRNPPPAPSVDPTVLDPDHRFDVRARLVRYDTDGWLARTQIPAAQVQMVDSASATATCSLTLSKLNAIDFADYSIVDIDVYNGYDWLYTNHRFVLARTQDDATDPTETATYSGTEFIDFELGYNYTQRDYFWDGATNHAKPTTPGQMLYTAIVEGQSRGWGPRIKIEFDPTHTSLGEPWANTAVSRNFTAGTPVSQILEGLVSDGLVEYRTEYREDGFAYLVLLNPGTGSDYSQGSSPVVNLSLAKLVTAPRQATIEGKVNAVTVVGDVPQGSPEGATNRVGRSTSYDDPDVFGRLEGWVQASGVTDQAALGNIGQNALRDNGSATNQRTYGMDATELTPQYQPYAVYQTGDWVLRPDEDEPVKDRIAQITISKTLDSFSVTVATGDRILSGAASIAKRQKAQVGGAIAAGNQTAPPPLNSLIPSAPTGFEVTSQGYWDTDGAAKSVVTISWAPVVQSLSGAPLDVGLYEVWWRPGDESTPYKLSTSTDDIEVSIPGWDPLEAIQLRVRAQSVSGIYGEFSEDQEYTTLAPTVDIAGPDLADLYTDGVGAIYAVWGGTLDGAPAPARLAYVVAEVSSDGGATYTTMGTPIVAAGAIVINPGAYGDYSVRLRGYDRLGNAGTVSDPQTISLVDPHINPPVPNAPTSLAAVAGADWGAVGILPEAWFDLTWDIPTTDVDGNDVSIAGYDIYGLKDGETIQRYLTTSATNSVRIAAGNNESWTFQVKAVSSFGGVSDFSDPVTQVADAVPSLAGAPTAPTLDQYAGILQIKWAGGGMLPQIKSVYASISQTVGGTYVRAGMPLLGAGEVDIPGLAPGDYYAKITIVDELGNSATSPASAKLTLLPITGVTIQTSPLANTGIKMTTGGITAYDDAGQPTFILNAATGEVWIAPYAAIIDLGASGTVATTGAATNGIAISAENSDFNTFIHPSGVQIRRDQTALSWWEADASDASQVNFFSPRAVIGQRLLVGDYEFLREAKTTGSRLVVRYKGA